MRHFRKCSRFHRFSELLYFSLNAILNTILREENIGKIYGNHKIREILNCDMTKTLEQNF